MTKCSHRESDTPLGCTSHVETFGRQNERQATFLVRCWKAVKKFALPAELELLKFVASKDKALRLWKFVAEDSPAPAQPMNIRAFKILCGLATVVQSIAAEPCGVMEREKKVLMIVILLQVLANVASVVIRETGPFIKDLVTWNQVFLLVDIICCAIIFLIVWSMRSLRETSKTNGKAVRNLAKLTLFRQFYIVVIGHLYLTRIVVFALRIISAYKYQWLANTAEEVISLAFYAVIFYMFRPVERNEYFVLDEEGEDRYNCLLSRLC